jgi:hypothetical protein
MKNEIAMREIRFSLNAAAFRLLEKQAHSQGISLGAYMNHITNKHLNTGESNGHTRSDIKLK